MASSFRVPHFPYITFIIFFAFSSSNGDDNANYTTCSIKYNCGNIQNVGYPFWGRDRPMFCGIPDYKLTCHEDNSTKISLGNNASFLHLKVLAINTSSHTINFSSTKLFERCIDPNYISSSFKLKAGAGYSNIRLFYNCSSQCDSENHSKSSNCSNNDDTSNHGKVYYFDKPSEIYRKGKLCKCNGSATFPVVNRSLEELRNTKAPLMNILTKLPIQTEYSANFTACSKCEESGGRCGSSYDSSSSQFVCYCRNGFQQWLCPPESGIWYCKKKSHPKFVNRSASIDSSASDLEKGSRYYGVTLFSYRELVEATNNCDQSKELGDGGFGIVYHGKLKDGREVAVKRLYEKNYRRIEQFMNEIHILTDLRHHNLVSLYGCTSQHCKELLLVYEYVSNGTVADHLFNKNTTSRSSLPWSVRLRIAIETATALSYLHASDIIRRDVKTNNILLDSNFCVKVADFGLSRLFPTDVTHVSTAPQGTPGYLDPEYHQCYQLTDKSDVYSFGVVLIELISSLPAIDMDRQRHEINLSNYATNRIQRGAFDELVDSQLGFATDFKVRRMTISVAELAYQCLQHDKNFRPSMDEVLEVLTRIEGADYEALLQSEENAKKAGEEVVNLHSYNLPPPLPQLKEIMSSCCVIINDTHLPQSL